MHLDFLFRILEEAGGRDAVVFRDTATSYADLRDRIGRWESWLEARNTGAGDVVALRADYSPDAIALFLALAQRGVVVLQAGLAGGGKLAELLETGEAEAVISVSADAPVEYERTGRRATHALYEQLRNAGHPGLVLFSSGSTGKSKGTVHDLSRLLGKYRTRRQDFRTIAFLLFDHIGGIDTLFYCLSNASCIVVVEQRDPATVCAAVERHRAQVLPVAPAFLNLLYFSQEYRRHDLSSLVYVTYGAEVMPEQTLRFCREMFPGARLLQKYGTSEVGTLRSQSRSSESLWVKIGGEGYEWRVVDGILQVKAASAMLGYLNAPSPFTEDGWFITGDCVEVDGEYLRFLGRDSDIINVGGKKVYPAEVEAALKELPEVIEATVRGERNALLGQIVTAQVWTGADMEEAELRGRLKRHAAARLEPYKAPARITITRGGGFVNDRFKKLRSKEP